MIRYALGFWGIVFLGCGEPSPSPAGLQDPAPKDSGYKTIGEIRVPPGYKRTVAQEGSFDSWLRRLPLKKDKTVYLYNGSVKPNQSAQFAVVDIPTGTKDLQQCADVVMRLRADYLFAAKQYDSIWFIDYNKKKYAWTGGNDTTTFGAYLEKVFGNCGSASLEKQLKPVNDFNSIQTGDVLIRGGFPGHAVLVADMAIDEKGKKVFLLVQGYQPAQDMHILVNPMDNALSPWYEVTDAEKIFTPEWTFERKQLRRW